jgi:uncharacterized iron-regulated protein
VLDDYRTEAIDRSAFLARTDWDDRWGYDFDLYEPILKLVKQKGRGGPLLALNAPAELVKRVGHQGLDKLSAADKKALPELDQKNEAHRSFFNNAIGGRPDHGGGSEEQPAPLPPGHPPVHGKGLPPGHPPIEAAPPSFENFYAAQLVRDETMAETAARWVLGAPATRRIVVIAGTGHCEDVGVPAMLRRRGVKEVISIRPVLDDGEGALGDALAAAETDLLVVLTEPKSATTASL